MFLWVDLDMGFIAEVFIISFSSIFFIAWNSQFPTHFEKMAWRAASIYMMTYGMIGTAWIVLWVWVLLPQKRLAEGHDMSLFEQSLPSHPGQVLVKRFLHRSEAPYGGPRFQHIEDASPELPIPPHRTLPGVLNRVRLFLSKTHNISPDKDPHLDAPIGYLIGTSVLCVLYVCFRMYILMEDLVGLRSLPSNAYDEVSWLSFIPHI
jgi:hypothetical protein